MRPTIRQLEAVSEHLAQVYIDGMLNVQITEAAGPARGELELRMVDHWGFETLRLDRKGEIILDATRPVKS
jgi:hypothetical protein